MRSLLVATALSIAVCPLAACQSGASIGATCASSASCASPLVCRFGRCRSECSAQRDCPLGTTCLFDASGSGSCALVDDPDCTSAGCDAPLACVGRECVNVCTLGPECPPGSACVPIGDGRARCVRTDGNDAGLSLDAFADDAFASDTNEDAGACTPPDCDAPVRLVVGDGFTCVMTMGQRAYCWGAFDSIGRDGDATGCTARPSGSLGCPTPAPLIAEDESGVAGPATDLDTFDAQDTGGCFTTHATSLVSCWGTSSTDAPLGRDLPSGERARLVEADGTHAIVTDIDHVFVFAGSAIAITHAGRWLGWGDDVGDVLRTGAASPYATTFAAPLVAASTIVTGPSHGCAIVGAAGDVTCWGSNDHGESDPSAPSATPVGPTTIAGVTGATQLVLGVTHSCALVPSGLVCWGFRDQLWLDTDEPTCPMGVTDCGPTLMPIGSLDIRTLVPVRNADDFCAIDTRDILHCWGGGYTAQSHSPMPVPDLPAVGVAAIEWTHGCAITTNSEVWCWGLNQSGELGRAPLVETGPQGAAPVVWP